MTNRINADMEQTTDKRTLTVKIVGTDGQHVRDVELDDPREAFVEEFNQRNRPLGVYAEIV
jgi:hypothetical protein